MANGMFLLLLNPDTVLMRSDTLKILVDRLASNPQIGLLSPLIEEPRKDKQVYPRYRYPSTGHLKYTKIFNALPGQIAWVLGACMLIKHSVFEVIGGFDPDYFLYGEDTDICLKLRLAKYEIGFAEDVRIMHVGGASEFGANTLEKWLRKKRGLYLFFTKHLDTRDVIRIAKVETLKSRIYLFGLQCKYLFNRNNASQLYLTELEDNKHRLQATIIAARESVDYAKKQLINQ
jgi:GT2 family glycosyltransferase